MIFFLRSTNVTLVETCLLQVMFGNCGERCLLQIYDGADMLDIQCSVDYWTVHGICWRDSVLDGITCFVVFMPWTCWVVIVTACVVVDWLSRAAAAQRRQQQHVTACFTVSCRYWRAGRQGARPCVHWSNHCCCCCCCCCHVHRLLIVHLLYTVCCVCACVTVAISCPRWLLLSATIHSQRYTVAFLISGSQ